jgi:hypothetical protein
LGEKKFFGGKNFEIPPRRGRDFKISPPFSKKGGRGGVGGQGGEGGAGGIRVNSYAGIVSPPGV